MSLRCKWSAVVGFGILDEPREGSFSKGAVARKATPSFANVGGFNHPASALATLLEKEG
ncbi:MAG: hypothetical protein GXZ02_11070 [Clostridiales bacterium]|nr:hypothetical protein [Clostridiales bacterium]